ncbi:MAG: ribosomal protein S18-alanine N-acetyltransferase [Elainellaceae cyanobacterium]
MKRLELKPLTSNLLLSALHLDQKCLGGLWTLSGYQRELESPNSDLMILQHQPQGSAQTGSPPSQVGHGTPYPDLLGPDLLGPDLLGPDLLGMVCLWSIVEEAHITLLVIHSDYRRQGLGQTLLHISLARAWMRGLEWATLEVRSSNQRAIALYQKFGFQEIGRRRRYYQDSGEDALILWRKGIQDPEFPNLLRDWWQSINRQLNGAGWQLYLDPRLRLPQFVLT